jgi:hypothetical protein
MVEEKRKHNRVHSLNILSYICLDENNNRTGEGMGRTLDISLGGILIETHSRIEAKYVLLLAVGFEDEVVDIRCEVVFSRQGSSGLFESGVRFLETDGKITQIIKDLVDKFKEAKKTTS